MAAITVEQFNAIVRHDLPWAYEIGMHADAIGDGLDKAVIGTQRSRTAAARYFWFRRNS